MMKLAIICFALLSLLLLCGQSGEMTQKDQSQNKVATTDYQILKGILQLTLDSGKLQGYFHFDEPGRETLYMFAKNMPVGLSLEKNGSPVKFVEFLADKTLFGVDEQEMAI